MATHVDPTVVALPPLSLMAHSTSSSSSSDAGGEESRDLMGKTMSMKNLLAGIKDLLASEVVNEETKKEARALLQDAFTSLMNEDHGADVSEEVSHPSMSRQRVRWVSGI